jgi:hypothetical protein
MEISLDRLDTLSIWNRQLSKEPVCLKFSQDSPPQLKQFETEINVALSECGCLVSAYSGLGAAFLTGFWCWHENVTYGWIWTLIACGVTGALGKALALWQAELRLISTIKKLKALIQHV